MDARSAVNAALYVVLCAACSRTVTVPRNATAGVRPPPSLQWHLINFAWVDLYEPALADEVARALRAETDPSLVRDVANRLGAKDGIVTYLLPHSGSALGRLVSRRAFIGGVEAVTRLDGIKGLRVLLGPPEAVFDAITRFSTDVEDVQGASSAHSAERDWEPMLCDLPAGVTDACKPTLGPNSPDPGDGGCVVYCSRIPMGAGVELWTHEYVSMFSQVLLPPYERSPCKDDDSCYRDFSGTCVIGELRESNGRTRPVFPRCRSRGEILDGWSDEGRGPTGQEHAFGHLRTAGYSSEFGPSLPRAFFSSNGQTYLVVNRFLSSRQDACIARFDLARSVWTEVTCTPGSEETGSW